MTTFALWDQLRVTRTQALGYYDSQSDTLNSYQVTKKWELSRLDTLDKGMIHIPGRTERAGLRFHYPAQEEMFRGTPCLSKTVKQRSKKYTSTTNIKDLINALQCADELPEEEIIYILQLMQLNIIHEKLESELRLELVDVILSYLRTMKPRGELEKMCTGVLMSLGSKYPQMVFIKLWDKQRNDSLPPRSLLVAVGELSLSRGSSLLIGRIWQRILRLLRRAREEDDMLAMCHALYGLVTSAREHLYTGHERVMAMFQKELARSAYLTFRVIFNRWSLKNKEKVTEQVLVIFGNLFCFMSAPELKNQVNLLIRWLMTLMSTNITPFYISQCICRLVDALALSGCGGVNLESQLENITNMLFDQLNKKVEPSDPKSVENHSLALRAFLILTRLYQNKLVSFIRKTMESFDPAKIALALQVFIHVFEEVPQTGKLQREVMNSMILVIQEDLRPVPKHVLEFIELLGHHNYLSLPQGNSIIYYIVQLCESDTTNEEDIRVLCSKILQMVSLPKLVTVACDPSNILAFVPLSKTAMETALKARSLGQAPYLSGFHLMRAQFISPQKLLTQLVLFSRKPYKVKEFGACSLRLLHALHPITSLHPVIHSSVGQLWNKVIPQMLKILDDHSEENLSQEEWEDRLLQFSSQSLVAINDNNWLEQLIRVILRMIIYFRGDQNDKAFLYKFFGFSLRTSWNEKLIKMMLSSILQTSHEELQDREGIAVALSILSVKHLNIVLEQLEVYSSILTDKDSSPILHWMKEHQQSEWATICNTIYIGYNKIILETKGAIIRHLDGILALVLQHYHNCIVEKDKNLKVDYLDALTILINSLSSQQLMAFEFSFSRKLSFINFMAELISEEPLNSISSPIRQKAVNIITNFRMFRPLFEIEQGVELLRMCFKSVFCLPPVDVLQQEASSHIEAQANVVDLFNETMESLQRLMEALIVEMPTQIQDCLELLDPWLNSQTDSERERAMSCAAGILGFAAAMENFKMEIEPMQLGRWVKLLAMHCQDPVGRICSLSSEAAYNLYYILSGKTQTGEQNQDLGQAESKSESCDANSFYRRTLEIGKAFAQFFTQTQLANLVLMAVEELTSSRAQLSLAAAQLMSAVIEERGRVMEQVEEVVEHILERLKLQLEPRTKEETLRALCLLAGNHTHAVVTLLLNKPLPWDRTILALWEVFGTRQEITINILQLLTRILEDHCTGETTEVALQPVAAVCALCEMPSESLCQVSIHELYPRLLLAVLGHLHLVMEQNSPLGIVVCRKDGGPGNKSKTFDPTSCALEVVKLLLTAACGGVSVYADQHKCWQHLSCPELYYTGIMELTSVIVKNCQPATLHHIWNLVESLLYSLDHHQKILARSFYAELLWHPSVAEALGPGLMGDLTRWIKEPDLIMKEIGLRGIRNLALHPGKSESLKSLVPFLRDFLMSEWRVTVRAVEALQNIITHGQGEDTQVAFATIAEQLRPLINDKTDEVRISATSALGHMLSRIKKLKPGSALQKEIYSFLVPLLLSLQDNNTDTVKACGRALTEWSKVIGWPSLTHVFQDTDPSDHIHVLEETCKYLVSRCKKQFLGDLLLQSFEFLKSTQPFLRAAAVSFIALIVEKINLNNIHEDDVLLLRNTLEILRNDTVETVQISAGTLLTTLVEHMNQATVSPLGIFCCKAQMKKRLF